MPIHEKKVSISLKPAKPTEITPIELRKELASIGLTCPDTQVESLKQLIADVKSQIPAGVTEAFCIAGPASPQDAASTLAFSKTGLKAKGTGNWEPSGSALGYMQQLEVIQLEKNFDWLKNNRSSFTGVVDNPPPYESVVPTIDAVKTMFVNVGVDASATLVKGIKKSAIEATLAKAISPLNDKNAKDYDVTDSRVIFLVDNYQPGKDGKDGTADAIGVLTIEWHLVIKDYLHKKQQPQHDATLTIKTRSALYDSVDNLNADVAALHAQFNEDVLAVAEIPSKKKALKIFDKRPPAVKDTFARSLLKKAKTDELEAVVLYAPDLQIIGSIDNTKSSTTTTYSNSVTVGFTFSATQSLSITGSIEASIEVVKVGLSITLNLSFTEQWSKSDTVTMTFQVPPGKKAFNYQGYIMAETIVFDPNKDTYSYKGEVARCLTNVLTSSEIPLKDKQ